MNLTYLCVVINSYNSCMIHGDCRVLTILVFRSVTITLLYLFHNALGHNDSSALPGHFTRTIPSIKSLFIYLFIYLFIIIFCSFLYTDETTITAENVLPLLYTAKKYCVSILIRRCLAFLNNGRSTDNICAILEQAHLYDEEEFLKKSLDYVLANARDVLQTTGFLDLCKNCLRRVISVDELQADERTVLDSVTKWAEHQCKKQNMEPTSENLRSTLGDILYLIRFPLLGEAHFTNVVSDSGILTDSEKVELFKYFYKSGGETKTFITRNRYAISEISQHSVPQEKKPGDRSIQTCMRFGTVLEEGSWYCGGEADAISFSANQNLWLHGVLVYGSYIGEAAYDINCSVVDSDDGELLHMRTQVKTSEHQLTYIILFETAICTVKNAKYTVIVRVTNPDGIDTYQGKDGSVSVNVGQVKFTFSKSKYSRNGTDIKMGQIPGLLFSL